MPQECSEGFYCPAGSTSYRQNKCGASKTFPAKWYCPLGSGSPKEVSDGYYSIPEDGPVDQRSGQIKCLGDQFACVNGKRVVRIEFNDDECSSGDGSWAVKENSNAETYRIKAQDNGSPAGTFTWSIKSLTGVPSGCGLSTDTVTVQGSGASDGVLRVTSAIDAEKCPIASNILLRVEAAITGTSFKRSCTLQIVPTNVNEQPTIGSVPGSSPSTAVTIFEDAVKDQLVGSSITSTDPDSADELAYSIQSVDPVRGTGGFRIGGCSGQLTVLDPSKLAPGSTG